MVKKAAEEGEFGDGAGKEVAEFVGDCALNGGVGGAVGDHISSATKEALGLKICKTCGQ
jgi:hypothetical protein